MDESTLFPSLLWTSLEASVHFVSSVLFFAAVLNYNFYWEEYHHLRFSSSLFSLLNVFVLESRLYERTVPVQSVVFQFRQVGRNVLEALGCSLTASWYGEFLESCFEILFLPLLKQIVAFLWLDWGWVVNWSFTRARNTFGGVAWLTLNMLEFIMVDIRNTGETLLYRWGGFVVDGWRGLMDLM